jgi:hypothetical protein
MTAVYGVGKRALCHPSDCRYVYRSFGTDEHVIQMACEV